MQQCKVKYKIKTVESSCQILDNKRIPINEEEREIRKGNIPYYGANGLQGYINDYIFDDNLILLAEDGGYFDEYQTRPIAYKISGKSWVNNHAHILKPNTDYNFNYIFYNLEHKNILYYINGGTRAKLTQQELKNIKLILVDDIKQQEKIAQILSTCDSVIEKTEETIEKYKRIKAGMMQDLFTRGLDKNGKLRPKYQNAPELYKYSEELGRYIPKDWEVKPLECIASILSGRDYKNNPIGSCNVPIYGTGGIIGYTTIPLYNGPAVLTGRKGSINTPYYVENDFWNVDTIFCLKMLDDNYAKWFYYQIYLTDMMKYNEATGVPSTTSKTLNKILFSVPKSNEQKNIANYISNIDSKIEIEKKYLFKYKQIKQGLMKKLLTPPADAEIVEE